MAWIELHQTLPQHRKILRLRVLLKIKTAQAVGHVCMIWLWALDNAQDGDLSDLDSHIIAEVAGYTKRNHQEFLKALIECGFIDEDMQLHDWNDYAGRLMERRETEKAYKERQNNLYSDMRLIKAVRTRDGSTCQYCGATVNWKDRRGVLGGTYDHIDPNGENTLENITVACRSCNSKKGGRKPAEAKMTFIDNSPLWQIYGRNTVEIPQKNGELNLHIPYRTVPNRTLPEYSGGGDAHARESENSEFEEYEENEDGDVENLVESASQHYQTLKDIKSLDPEVKARFYKTADLLFTQYFQKQAQEYDYTILYRLIRWVHIDTENKIYNPTVQMSEDDIELLTNAFEAAAMADKKNLAYIQGVIKRYRERGIQSASDFWGYEIKRDERGRQASENRKRWNT